MALVIWTFRTMTARFRPVSDHASRHPPPHQEAHDFLSSLLLQPEGEGVWPGDGTVDEEGAGVCPGARPVDIAGVHAEDRTCERTCSPVDAAGREEHRSQEHLQAPHTSDRHQKRPTYRAFRASRRALTSGQGHFQGQADSTTDPLSLDLASHPTQPDLHHLDLTDVRDVIDAAAVAPPSLSDGIPAPLPLTGKQRHKRKLRLKKLHRTANSFLPPPT
jgi:hypothetical protein